MSALIIFSLVCLKPVRVPSMDHRMLHRESINLFCRHLLSYSRPYSFCAAILILLSFLDFHSSNRTHAYEYTIHAFNAGTAHIINITSSSSPSSSTWECLSICSILFCSFSFYIRFTCYFFFLFHSKFGVLLCLPLCCLRWAPCAPEHCVDGRHTQSNDLNNFG